jgi:phenylalanyl-tRNA synthetase beta chain
MCGFWSNFMKFSYNFLKQFLHIEATPREVADKLTSSGTEVAALEAVGNDTMFEVELTSDRPDLLSMAGLSYEVGALSDRTPEVKFPPAIQPQRLEYSKLVRVEDNKDCPYYTLRVIRGVTIKDSPAWLKDLLVASGLRPVNNVVDITNYCLLKWGAPLHAFDCSTLDGGITVRRAGDREKLLCIDGRERELSPEHLVIADDRKAVAIAGIMGGKDTEITDNTTDIALECALFDSVRIRLARKALGMNTDSSYRFERFVYPPYIEAAARDAISLILELAGGTLVGETVFGSAPVLEGTRIEIDMRRMNEYMGADIPQEEAARILTGLRCGVERNGSVLTATTPAWRQDLRIAQDLYEEIVRIWGLEKVPTAVPLIKKEVRPEGMYEFKGKLRDKMIALGFHEAVTFNIVQNAHPLRDPNAIPVVISNPLKEPENLLRTHVYPGLIDCVQYNVSQRQSGVDLFEIAHVFSRTKDCYEEQEKVCLVSHRPQEADSREFKGRLEALLKTVTRGTIQYQEEAYDYFSARVRVLVNGSLLGFWGVLDKTVAQRLDLSSVFVAELDVALLRSVRQRPEYERINYFPQVDRDISIAIEKGVQFSRIEEAVRAQAGGLLKELVVIDVYRGKSIAPAYMAFTLRVSYQHSERTLESEEVDAVHVRLREKLAALSGVTLR